MRSRTIALLLVCLASAMLFGGASTATAQSGYGGADSAVLPATAQRGSTVEVRSTGWLAGADVTITLYSEPVRLGEFTTDNTGRLAATVTIPVDTPLGRHTVELAGLRADSTPRVLSQPIQIVDPGTGGGSNDGVSGGGSNDSGSGGSSDGAAPGQLSRTGPRATVQLLQAGGVFLAAGAFALVIGRRATARSSTRVVATRGRRSQRRSRTAPLVGTDHR